MHDLGPAWLRTELPYPIANAIHLAELHEPLDDALMATVVEVALRFVTGIHLANLDANRTRLPERLRADLAGRHTLGAWLGILKELRKLNTRPFAPALAHWPTEDEVRILDRFVSVRNKLAHPGTLMPEERRSLDDEMAVLTPDVLMSLKWMRQGMLFHMSDPKALPAGGFHGGLHLWRGLVSHRPPRQPVTWRGDGFVPSRMYFGFQSSDGQIRALDVHGYIRFETMPQKTSPQLVIWRGFGRRGDVAFHDPATGVEGWLPAFKDARTVNVVMASALSVQSAATLPDSVKLLARDAVRSTGPAPFKAAQAVTRTGTAPSQRKPLVWGAVGALFIAVALGAWAGIQWAASASMSPDVVSKQDAPPSAAPESPLTSTPTKQPGTEPHAHVRPELGRGPAHEDRQGAAGLERLESARAALHGCAEVPSLTGDWVFKTTVLGANPDRKRSKGINGYYRISLATPEGCLFETEFVKTGFSGSAQDYKVAFADKPPFIASTSGASAAGLAILRTKPTAPDSTDIGFRVMRVGKHLVGLWRYEGLARNKAGFWGGLVGKREGAAEPPSSACFLTCIEQCHGDRPAHDEGTERCLTACGPKLLSCDE